MDVPSGQESWFKSEDGGELLKGWSEAELYLRESALTELAETFEDISVPYFLADGTLLGAVRDGDFIPWDPDVGVWIKAEDFVVHKKQISDSLSSRGFSIVEVSGRNPKLNVYKHGEKFELESWRLRGKYRVRGGYVMPANLLDLPGKVTLRGRTYPCPSPVEEFLSQRFGDDWRTPRVLIQSHSSSKTRWALTKENARRLSPRWLLRVLGRS